MLLLNTAASVLTVALIFEFFCGLLQLWDATKTPKVTAQAITATSQETPLEATKEPSFWDMPLEVLALPTAPATVPSVIFQLCLPPSNPPEVDTKEVATSAPVDLASLGIRALKKLASEAKVRGYGKMTKIQLVTALS